MDQNNQVFELRLRAKLSILFLFSLVGGPLLYAVYLNYQAQEQLYALLMAILFLIWMVVIFMASRFKIKLTKSSIYREGLFFPSIIKFSEVDAIYFGSEWSNFYVKSKNEKISFGKDFEHHEKILHSVVEKVEKAKNIEEVHLMGDVQNIEEYIQVVSNSSRV